MRHFLILFFCLVALSSCGYDFYMNRKHVDQTVHISNNEHTLSLDAQTAVGDDFLRSHMVSDFYRGYADIIYDNGVFNINYRNLPVSESQMDKVKNDLYAIYFAGDYPYKSQHKIFGKTEIDNSTKKVYDTDGYLLYKVHYDTSEIFMYNIINDYSIVIDYMSGFREN